MHFQVAHAAVLLVFQMGPSQIKSHMTVEHMFSTNVTQDSHLLETTGFCVGMTELGVELFLVVKVGNSFPWKKRLYKKIIDINLKLKVKVVNFKIVFYNQ